MNSITQDMRYRLSLITCRLCSAGYLAKPQKVT